MYVRMCLNGVLIREISAVQWFTVEESHIHIRMYTVCIQICLQDKIMYIRTYLQYVRTHIHSVILRMYVLYIRTHITYTHTQCTYIRMYVYPYIHIHNTVFSAVYIFLQLEGSHRDPVSNQMTSILQKRLVEERQRLQEVLNVKKMLEEEVNSLKSDLNERDQVRMYCSCVLVLWRLINQSID